MAFLSMRQISRLSRLFESRSIIYISRNGIKTIGEGNNLFKQPEEDQLLNQEEEMDILGDYASSNYHDSNTDMQVSHMAPNMNQDIDRALPKTNEDFNFLRKLSVTSVPGSKSLKVAIIGMPNAGKSTLVNNLIGTKIAAVSKKVHTTRRSNIGVLTIDDTQIELLDTPGLVTHEHCHKHSLEQTFISHPYHCSRVADLLLVLVDASNKRDRLSLNSGIISQLSKNRSKPSILVINKIDMVSRKRRLIDISNQLTMGHIDGQPIPNIDSETKNPEPNPLPNVQYERSIDKIERRMNRKGHIVQLEKENGVQDDNIDKRNIDNEDKIEYSKPVIGWKNFEQVFMVSALDGSGIDDLRNYLLSKSIVRDWSYHPSLLTPTSPSLLVGQIIKEKLLDNLNNKTPYVVTPKITSWIVTRTGTIAIAVDLITTNSWNASNILGPKGITISKIGQDARQALANAFKTDIRLLLVVKVPKKKKVIKQAHNPAIAQHSHHAKKLPMRKDM